MLKCVLREAINHDNIEDYSGPDVIYYFTDDVTDTMYMVAMDNEGNNYPFIHIMNENGFNVTFEEWKKNKGLS